MQEGYPTLTSFLPFIIGGIQVTLLLTVASVALSVPVAVILALGRMSRWRLVSWPTGFVIEFLRGSSALVQLFWAFYVLPFFGIDLPPLTAAILVLGLSGGAYFSEVVRAGLTAVPAGQREAAKTLHLGAFYAFRRVYLPQALPIMIPPFANFAISMLKYTSLASLVTVHDLSYRTNLVRLELGESGPIYLVTLTIYLAIALVISFSLRRLEKVVGRSAGRPVLSPRASSIPSWAFGR